MFTDVLTNSSANVCITAGDDGVAACATDAATGVFVHWTSLEDAAAPASPAAPVPASPVDAPASPIDAPASICMYVCIYVYIYIYIYVYIYKHIYV